MSESPFPNSDQPSEFFLPGENEKQSLERIRKRIDQIESLPAAKKKFWQWVLIGALVLAALSLGLFIKTKSVVVENPPMAELYFKSYPNYVTDIKRGEQDPDVSDAYAAYENNNFEQAVKEFERLVSLTPEDQLYYAISLQGVKKWSSSFEALSQLDDLKNEFHDARDWYMSLSMIAIGNEEAAKLILTRLSDSNNFFSESARELLDKL